MSLNRPLLFVIALCAAATAAALECRVVLPDGSALSGARVTVIGRSELLVADGEGHFDLDPVPEIPFVLFIARPDGVALRPVTVAEVPGQGLLTVEVAPIGKTVTVVSGVVPDLELPPAVAATVMGRGDLGQRLPAQLFQTLENLPGAGTSGDGHAAVPSIRGLPQHRTLLLLDDGRVSSERRAGASATYLDPETIDEVEVIRGPGSVAYGSDAFGGIIRVRTRMPDPQGSNELRFNLIGGRGLDQLGAAAEATTGLFGGGFMVGAHYRNYDDYQSPEGTVFNSSSEMLGFRAGWQAAVFNGILHVGWRTDEARDVGKPTPDSEIRRVFYPEEKSNRLSLGYERPGPGRWNRLSLTFGWDDYSLTLAKDRFATGTTPRDVAESLVDANDFSIRADAERPLGEWRMVLGADVSGRYNLGAVNEYSTFGDDGDTVEFEREVSIENAYGTDLGVFLSLGRGIGKWHLDFGVRGDGVWSANRGGYFGDLDTSNSAISGFAAAGFALTPDLELTAQVARGFRDPLLSDRYYRGESGRGFITGNPDLDPETSLQFDLALRFSPDSMAVGLYVYRYRIFDLIERFREGDNFFFRNRGESEITGIEVETGFGIGNGLEFHAGAHYLQGEVVEDGSPTDGVPPPGVFAVLRGNPGERWWWMVRGAAYAGDDRPGPTEQEVPGYGVLDAGAGFTITDWLEVSILGRNLLDRSYFASSDEDAVLAPGRSLQLVLRGRL
ncbi:MAG: TonB-dependent receptor [Thermoanaerobaculales bacterium]|nr:TonB-dependent receptor [Thermoanaerobaculales bacterium]